jgi:uncharacterized repeat protein (TIGR01451 family)
MAVLALVAATPASAATAPGGYVDTGAWTGSGSTFTSPLPAPYAGTVTYTAGAGQTTVLQSGSVRSYPSTTSSYQYCLNGYTTAPNNSNTGCATYTATFSFSSPVTDPVLMVALSGGGWSASPSGDCAEYWENVTVSGVNGSAPSPGQLTPASPIDAPLTWDGSTLAYPPSEVTCSPVDTGYQYLEISGTVTSVTLTYTVAAKSISYSGGQIGASAIGGTTVAVLVPTIESDLAVVKSGAATGAVDGAVTWQMVVTNNGPDPAFSWTLTDPLPQGFAGATTSTPGCSLSGSTLTCTGSDLAVGASRTIEVTGTASTTGVLSNTATVSTTSSDTVPSNNSSTATVTVIAVPLATGWVLGLVLPLGGLGALVALRRRRARTAGPVAPVAA